MSTLSPSSVNSIIKSGGVVGLLAVILTIFLVSVVYKGQERNHETQIELLKIANQALVIQQEQTRVLTDIRYTIKAANGITFRN